MEHTTTMQMQPNTPTATIDIPDEYIDAFLQLLELRTKEAVAHSRRVAALSEELATAAGLAPGWSAQVIRPAALLHHVLRPWQCDIGKIAFPDRLLTSANGLRPADRPLVEAHPVFAEQALTCISGFPPRGDAERVHCCRLCATSMNGGNAKPSSRQRWKAAATRTDWRGKRYRCPLG